MRIVNLAAFIVRLPLKREIKHASATRHDSENLLVRCRLMDGTEGWGEGVPRSYVTGETPEGALEQLAATPLADQLGNDCTGWPDVLAMCERFQLARVKDDPRGCYGNALQCAVELSILDAFGKLLGEPLSKVTELYAPAQPVRASRPRVRYSGAVLAEGPMAERISAAKMRIYGFAHCKVKVGVPSADDPHRVGVIRRWLGRRMDIRLDANEAWHAEEAVARIEPLLKHRISCVEQPVPHEEVESLAEVRRRLPVPLMLDESLTGLFDATTAIRQGTCDVFNLRLSKCGGYLACLRLAALAHGAGLAYQLGCHPGESGILSAAGRHWAATVGDIRYLEGSYDRHMLSELLTNEDITFGYGGWAPALTRPGLGVTAKLDAIRRVTVREQVYSFDR